MTFWTYSKVVVDKTELTSGICTCIVSASALAMRYDRALLYCLVSVWRCLSSACWRLSRSLLARLSAQHCRLCSLRWRWLLPVFSRAACWDTLCSWHFCKLRLRQTSCSPTCERTVHVDFYNSLSKWLDAQYT